MKYRIIDSDAGPTLVLSDQLLFDHRDIFDTAIDKLLARKQPFVAVDMAGLTYMDSAGLGMLLTLRDRAEHAGIGVSLLRPSKDVAELLDLACFGSLFTIERG
ncbi:STAS domain-containing protein [Magnetospirillum sulfuroxidans]|uniref:STAS domain-containing protein n=1 Tax=Magnetospirillum sulfuroxidans TaxID=611300 RepID=A0ABS5IDP0_9PROT|nr:STAS domain-containing protein [Magnetospirillum sulfuroxidans]MBR9972530.1 STAS domain-containing protein [Magnetospirillum sulfuroxidans]